MKSFFSLKHYSGTTRFWMIILMLLYGSALFAGFLAPYTSDFEQREFSYAPPSALHFFDENGNLSWPFIYDLESNFNDYHERIYTENMAQKHPLEFFIPGDSYTVLGIFSASTHLFGTSEHPLYLFGADSRGRDIFSRILYGGQISLTLGLVGTLITFFIGITIGCISGYFGGKIDFLLMRLSELIILIPSLYLLLALRAVFPLHLSSEYMYFIMILILSFMGWAMLSRIIRGMVMSLKEKEFIIASQALGQSSLKIILFHIIPNLASYLTITFFFSIPMYILGESTLSFLGLGIQDPAVSWGNMLSAASSLSELTLHPWLLTPGIFLLFTILAFNIIADRLRDTLDPQYQSS